MLIWVLQTIILSVVFICIVHFLVNYFTSMLTVPKFKDLVYSPNKKYEHMFYVIHDRENTSAATKGNYSSTELLPQADSMKTELKNFLKQINHSAPSGLSSSTDISSLQFTPF
jgi:hypothetical protein